MPITHRIYGHYLSQPSRAVLWAATIKKLPFELKKVNPVLGDAQRPEYLAKFPTGYAPALEVLEEGKEPIRIAESGAILPYLAKTNGWEDLYPSGPAGALQRAKIQQWMHWCDVNLRFATTNVFRPNMVEAMRAAGENVPLFADEVLAAKRRPQSVVDKQWKDAMLTMTHGALKDSPFLASKDGPTIADLSLYCEIDQIHYAGLYDFTAWPEVYAWIKRMQQVPEHDSVRKTLFKYVETNKCSFLPEFGIELAGVLVRDFLAGS